MVNLNELMTDNIIKKISNSDYLPMGPEYYPPSIEGYLIIGEKDNKVAINHYGEQYMPHEKAIILFQESDIPVFSVYIGGDVSKLSFLAKDLEGKSITDVIQELDAELLTQ